MNWKTGVYSLSIQSTGGHDILRTPNATIPRTKTELKGEGFTFESVKFFGPPISIGEVFMGSMASIVRAGQFPNGTSCLSLACGLFLRTPFFRPGGPNIDLRG